MKTTQLITVAQLSKIVPGLSAAAADNFVPFLNAAMLEQGITARGERCAFIANLAHESQHFTRWFENLNYKAPRLLVVFRKYFKNPVTAARYAGKPELIANRVYANRMGNGDEASGDGWRYRGRGPIGLTGRENYQVYGDELGIDLVSNPDLAAQPEHGFRIAARFWKRTNCDDVARGLTCNKDADRGKLTIICKRINGGLNGLEDRIELFDRAARVLGPAVSTMPGTAVPAVPPAPAPTTSTIATNGEASGDPNLPAKSDTSESNTDLLSTALNSSNAKTAATSLWSRVGKHALFSLGAVVTFIETHKTAALIILGVLLWIAYHNRKKLKAKLLEWLKQN